MRKIKLFFATLFFCGFMYGQNVNVQQSQQNVNINLPVIERNVYIERFRVVYRDRPQPARVARRLDAPVQLLGYLWVHTQDLGNFRQHPHDVIRNINAQSPYGRNNWRIPTHDELMVMENNANLIGLGDGIYMATSHSNGILRLVSTGASVAEQNAMWAEAEQRAAEMRRTGVVINGVRWAYFNVASHGAFVSSEEQHGGHFSWDEALNACPSGWRLPTGEELRRLTRTSSIWTARNGVSGRLFGTAPYQVFLPSAGRYGNPAGTGSLFGVDSGTYWSSTPAPNSFHIATLDFDSHGASVSYGQSWRFSVRCVAE